MITLIGSGNVATWMAQRLAKSVRFPITQVFSRKQENARRLADMLQAEAIDDIKLLNPENQIFIFALADNAYDEILPQLPDGYGDDPKKNERDNLIQNYFWLKDGCYRFKRGMEITVEFWGASKERMEQDEHLREHLQNPIFAACAPEYYCSVGVFPPVSPAVEGEFDGYEQAFRTSFENLEKGRRERGEYGWMSFEIGRASCRERV